MYLTARALCALTRRNSLGKDSAGWKRLVRSDAAPALLEISDELFFVLIQDLIFFLPARILV